MFPIYWWQLYGIEHAVNIIPIWRKFCGQHCGVAFPVYSVDISSDSAMKEYSAEAVPVAQQYGVTLIPQVYAHQGLWVANPEMPHDDTQLAAWVSKLSDVAPWKAMCAWIDNAKKAGFAEILFDFELALWMYASSSPCFKDEKWIVQVALGFQRLVQHADMNHVTLRFYHPWRHTAKTSVPEYAHLADVLLAYLPVTTRAIAMVPWPYAKPVTGSFMRNEWTRGDDEAARCVLANHPPHGQAQLGFLSVTNAFNGFQPWAMKQYATSAGLWPDVWLFGNPIANLPLLTPGASKPV